MKDVPSVFGSMVFNDAVMRARLPKDTYKALKKTISQGTHLELDVANVVASAMKDWAVEKGATHFTHVSRLLLCALRILSGRSACCRSEGQKGICCG